MSIWKEARLPLVASLVTTYDHDKRVNASPKSWWTPTSYDPPLLVVSIRTTSDSALNVEETGVFCLHVPPGDDDEVSTQVLHTAKTLPRGENELDDVGLPWSWMSHPTMTELEFPVVVGMPYFGCMVRSKFDCGDHTLYEGQVVLAAMQESSEDPREISSVLVHRGQNVFVHLGDEWKAERY